MNYHFSPLSFRLRRINGRSPLDPIPGLFAAALGGPTTCKPPATIDLLAFCARREKIHPPSSSAHPWRSSKPLAIRTSELRLFGTDHVRRVKPPSASVTSSTSSDSSASVSIAVHGLVTPASCPSAVDCWLSTLVQG